MRISTANFYETSINRISDKQSALAKAQQQISTGRRILTPSDDPVGASRALQISQSQGVNAQFATNRQYVKDSLNFAETTLGTVTSVLQDMKGSVIQAGNGALSDADRNAIATDLQEKLSHLVSLANSRDGTGKYLFSGHLTNTEPFTRTGAGAIYNGNGEQQMVQVDGSRQIAMSVPGNAVFPVGTPDDIFRTLTDVITLLQTPGTNGLATGLSTANGNVDSALDNVLAVRAAIGSRLKEIDSLDSLGEDVDLQYKTALSAIQDLDYAKIISELTQQKITLEAAQQSFVQISRLSLFNFLN